MTIQFNTDHNIKGGEALTSPLKEMIDQELTRYSDHITTLLVHLSDEDGNKDGGDDKRCLLEARLEGRKPIAVKSYADTHEQALAGAIDKLKSTLNTILGKLHDPH